MPLVAVTVWYTLSDDEAMRRLQQRYDAVKAAYGEHLQDLEEQWDGRSLRYGFSSLGLRFEGVVTAAQGQVSIQVDLPPLASLFRREIERRLREELTALLAEASA